MSQKSSMFLLIITILGLLHALLFVLYWLTNNLFYAEVNNFLFEKLGWRLDYIRLVLVLSIIILLWSGARLVFIPLKSYRPGWGAWLYAGVIILYFAFFYGSFWMLFNQSPVQWVRLLRLVGYYRIFTDVLFLVALSIVFMKIEKWLTGGFSGSISKLIFPYSFLGIFILIWSAPLLFPPASVRRTPLPSKPRLIAHRGASMLAPENTLAAARRAAALGADGLEVDIRISLDGVPFLMHDHSLSRTTDVASRFPDRKENAPESFTLAELKQLNAGEWFTLDDPYHTIAKGLVSESEIQEIRQERIPTLAEVLDFMKGNEMGFIFDLISPPDGHPYQAQFFDICFNLIHQAGIDSRVWFLAKGEQRQIVASSAPEMVLAYGADYADPPGARELVEPGYQIVNVEYGLSLDRIKKYQLAGQKVNLYVVDEPWMFSRLWLAGADSMTTNNVHTLVALDKPILDLPYASYLLVYCLVALGSLGLTLFSKI